MHSTPSPKPPEEQITQWLHAAVEHHQRDALEEAQIYYSKILEIQPDHADAMQLLGLIHKRLGNRKYALELMHHSVRINANQPNVWFNLGNTYSEDEQFDAAYEAYKQAVVRDPHNVQIHFNIGLMCRHLHSYKEAEAAFKVTLQLQNDYPEAWRNLGIVYKAQGRSTDALKAYAKALEADGLNPLLHTNIGNMFKAMGRREESEAAYREAVRLRPEFAEAHRHLANAHSYTVSSDPHIGQMEALMHRHDLPEAERMQLCFALAKAYHEAGGIVKSWKYLEEGNTLKRKHCHYDSAGMEQWFDDIIDAYPKHVVQRQEGESRTEDTPVFVVGMPRSGTSLVEQILASHTEVHGAGELDDLRMLVQRVWPRWYGDVYPKEARKLSAHHKLQLAGEYLRMLGQYMPQGKTRVTDKMPGNFRFIGLIHQLLPNAKIIHCVRDPMDTCVSIYRHYFSGHHPYAYDMRELGMYHRQYQRLMAHWHDALPEGVILDIPYEELVENQELHTRRLLDFCNLSWDDACLAFHKTERPVHTASAMQVRQPIYTQSIGKWQNEVDYLRPLLDALNV